MAVKRLLISVILSLAVHATILGTKCAWLTNIPAAGPKPAALNISLGLRQPPELPKATVAVTPIIPYKEPALPETAPPKPPTPSIEPKILKPANKESIQPAQTATAKIVNTQNPPTESQPTDSPTTSEAINPSNANTPPAHAIPQSRPFYRQHPPPKYPKIARIRGYQGNVLLEVLVDRRGNVADLRLVQSSGYPILDQAAEDAVKTWLFEPGLIGKEKADMWIRIPIRFELK